MRNPRDQAGFLSLLTASWINDVLKLGSKQPLEEKHLLAVGASYQAERLVADLEREWLAEERASEENRTKPRLWRAMMRVIPCRDYVTVAFLRMIYFIGFNLFPLIVWFFLKSISTSAEISYTTTLPIIIGIALVTFMRTLSSNYASFQMNVIATKLKVAMTGLVYKKASNFHHKTGSNRHNTQEDDGEPFSRRSPQEKYFSEPPTGVNPMTYQNTGWSSTLQPLSHGRLVLSKVVFWVLFCVTRVVPYCEVQRVEMIYVSVQFQFQFIYLP